ncbi:hydrogenase maturation protease [Streptomyces sp. NPDC008265]|uniref:hydrogenase maturation protease n=1 Tax=Streptomyces sp. NPDC008265 TaxID=3364824 RepID=UPI0036E6EA78
MDAVGRTVVIGLGNEFRRDDGLGWAVAGLLERRAAQRQLPPGVVVARCDGDPGRLIALWEGAGLVIVVDACFPPLTRPGRTHRWAVGASGGLDLAAPARHSTHGLGFAEALRLSDALGRSPRHLIVYAVEGADQSTGMGMTAPVARAVPRLLRRITADIEQHGEPADGTGVRQAGPPSGTRRTTVTERRPPA